MAAGTERTMVLAPNGSTRLERRPMSRAEFDAMAEGIRAEYVTGMAIVTPPPNLGHNVVAGRTLRLLQDALPDLLVVHEVGLALPTSLRIPDIAVLASFEATAWQTQPPVLVVEVLSPGTRTEDMLRKPAEYLSAGIEHYWLVDREAGTLTVLVSDEGAWAIAHELDAESPSVVVSVGEHGVVEVDVRALIPREFRN